jgi:hypothetical protein
MPQVLNRSKNAQAKVSTAFGVINFTQTKNGMLSEEISQEAADSLVTIPTYVAVKAAPAPATKAAAPVTPDPAAQAAADAAAAEAARQAAEQANAAAAAEAAQKQA